MKSNKCESIKKVVEDVLTSLGQGGRIPETRIFLSWEKIVGSQIASRSFPYYLKSGVLMVAVDNSVWMNQLNFFRDEIVEKINLHLKDEPVHSIRLVLRKKPAWWPLKKREKSAMPIVSPKDQQMIEQACGTISDPELKEIVSRFLSRYASNEQVKRLTGITRSRDHHRKK